MRSLRRLVKCAVKAALRPLSDRWVYTARSGLAQGMRIKGGFLFLPKPTPKEAPLLEAIAPNLKGKVVYDIGANIGITTLFFAKHVGEEGLVVAFEPVPPTARRLRENIALNKMTQVRIYEFALGDYDGEAEIYYLPESSGIATIRKEILQQYGDTDTVRRYLVTARRLDTVIQAENLPLPDFIKIDTEGYEYQVIEGASLTLSQARPELFIELHSASEDERIIAWRQLYDHLIQMEYWVCNPSGKIITQTSYLQEGNLWYCVPKLHHNLLGEVQVRKL